MRIFTLIVSLLFVAAGIGMVRSGRSDGWLVAGFFGCCAVVAVIEPRLPKPWVSCGYTVFITAEGIACEHQRRGRESVRWEDVIRVWYVTTSDGPRLPDEWILLEANQGGCSFPTEVANIHAVWDEMEQRFPGFDFAPVIRGGTDDARHLCWEKRAC